MDISFIISLALGLRKDMKVCNHPKNQWYQDITANGLFPKFQMYVSVAYNTDLFSASITCKSFDACDLYQRQQYMFITWAYMWGYLILMRQINKKYVIQGKRFFL